jgi:hypothetical protein
VYQLRPCLHLVIDGPSNPVGPYARLDTKQGCSMSAHTAVDETRRLEQLVADLKIPSGDLTGVPQQLADAIAQAGLEASTGTIAFAGKQSSGNYPVEFNDQNGEFSSRWPQWAFEVAKAALLSQQCSAAEALQAVTRSGGRGGPGGGLNGGHRVRV